VICGSYGFANLGDEAILEALVEGFRSSVPSVSLTVVTADVSGTRTRLGVEAVDWADWGGIAEAVSNADLVVSGGGGIFFDYGGWDPSALCAPRAPALAFYCGFPLLAGLLEKPLAVCGVGVGPLRDPETRNATRAVFEMASSATVRDEESLAVLAACGVDTDGLEVTADPALLLEPAGRDEVDAALRSAGVIPGEPLLAVVPRAWDGPGVPAGWEAEFGRAAGDFAARAGVRLLVVPFQERDDALLVARFREAAGTDRTAILGGCAEPRVITGVLGRCGAVAGMRLHALVLASVTGTPFAAVSYDPKVRNFARRLGFAENVVDLGELDRLGAVLDRVWAGREAEGRRLAAAGQALLPLARRNVEAAVRLLEAGSAAPLSRAGWRLAAEALTGRLRAVGERDARIHEAEDRLVWKGREVDGLRDLASRLETREAELNRDLAAAKAEVDSLRMQLEGLRGELEISRSEAALLRDEDARLRAQRGQLQSELATLHASRGVKLILKVWEIKGRLLRRGVREASRRSEQPAAQVGAEPPGTANAVDPAALATAAKVAELREGWRRFAQKRSAGGAPGIVCVFSATQLVESEGQRPSHWVHELSRKGYTILFAYWRWWPDQFPVQDRLRDGVYQVPIDLVVDHADAYLDVPGPRERSLWVEFPHPSAFTLVATASALGWLVLYDVLDEWEEFHRVGQAAWYDRAFEEHLCGAADGVVAVNDYLAGRVRALGCSVVEVVPNGLKPGIERVDRARTLSRGEVTVGYFGHLTAAWFDWTLLAGAARARPSWRFYVIGYGGEPGRVELPGNVQLLGRKPQTELAAWAANWDVAIVPFQAEALAAGADPIKTYEYLAMGLPVVVTGVGAPRGAETLVRRATGLESFVAAIEVAAAEGPEAAARRRAFAATCRWEVRLGAILDLLRDGQRVGEKRALVGIPS